MVPVERVYGSDPGKPSDLTGFSNVNFARIAEDFGCRGIRVEHPEEIGPALDAALASDRPTVVDVVTNARPRAPVPWAPGAR
jgi:acetolactate synthase-1/2/3 large subunit